MEHGAKSEWICRGMLSATFSPVSNKLAAVEHVFDVTSLMQQLQKWVLLTAVVVCVLEQLLLFYCYFTVRRANGALNVHKNMLPTKPRLPKKSSV